MPPRLTADIKEHICRIAHECDIRSTGDDTQQPPAGARHFSRLCFELTHVDSEWRRVGLRYAWHTVYVDDRLPHDTIAEMRTTHGRHTRKLWVQVSFGGIASHYRRYSHARDNSDIQPFCDLHRWPRLHDLEISYAHKCAFPALAAYIEPRLGPVRRLTISGRVPIDMRRGALVMKSEHLQEIYFRALPRGGDSLLPILGPNDPSLLLPVSDLVRAITLTALIDTKTVRWVLAQTRPQLERLSVIGLSASQLTAAGLQCQSNSAAAGPPASRTWTRLRVLVVSVRAGAVGDALVRLDLDAAEFPQLERLSVAGLAHPAAATHDPPPLVTYGGMFTKVWPRLAHLYLPTLSCDDAWSVVRTVPKLATIRVQPTQGPLGLCTLQRLLASLLPSRRIVVSCASTPARRAGERASRPRLRSESFDVASSFCAEAATAQGIGGSTRVCTTRLVDYWRFA
ncbi:hypothetical protein H4R19_001242 [Coemansia spiralis]|nr:hypothetical protein H4R19_001242 [Coemansia spiralis]